MGMKNLVSKVKRNCPRLLYTSDLIVELVTSLRDRVNLNELQELAIGPDLGLPPKLGRQEDVLPPLSVQGEPLAYQVLIVAIQIGRVPVGGTDLPSAIEDFESLVIGAGGEGNGQSRCRRRLARRGFDLTYRTFP